MKKQIYILLIASVATSYAQLTNAILFMQDGQIRQAKENIDKYMAKEKSATDAKGWFYKGNIYESIAFSKDTAVRKLETQINAIKTITEAYNKSLSLDKPNGEFAKQIPGRLEGVWASAYNIGIEKHQAQESKIALEYMNLASAIKPTDTMTVNNAASIAVQSKDFVYAKDAYTKLISLGNKAKKNYSQLYYIVKEELKDKEATEKVLTEALSLYPTDSYFMAEEINMAINSGKKDEAIAKLNKAIENDQKNAAMYYYNLGILYKQSNDAVKSKENFQKSLEIDPLNEGSNYMMGFISLDEGDILNKKINAMSMKEYTNVGKALEPKRDDLYKSAIPYLEKSYDVSKDGKLKTQINNLYNKMKINKKID